MGDSVKRRPLLPQIHRKSPSHDSRRVSQFEDRPSRSLISPLPPIIGSVHGPSSSSGHADTPAVQRMGLHELAEQARKPIEITYDSRGQPMERPHERLPQMYLDIISRATDIPRLQKEISEERVSELQMDILAELGELYNSCAKSLQRAGPRAVPHVRQVSVDFFPSEEHCQWRGNFKDNKLFLEGVLLCSHPLIIQLNDLCWDKCSSLSFFRQLHATAFPIDNDLFNQIQQAQIRYASEVLHTQLEVGARAIFNSQPEHKWIEPMQLDRLLLCARRVMSLHLEKLLFNTLEAVLKMFERFESEADISPLFILNLIVDDDSRVRYSPEMHETLDGISSLLDMVKNTICSISVIPSELVTIEGYDSLKVVSLHEADVMLHAAKSHLATIYRQKTKEPDELLAQFKQYDYLLSEPSYVFPRNWHSNQVWRSLVPRWQQVWQRSRRLMDEIEVLAKDEEQVGMFIAITSGPVSENLVTEALVSKAQRLGDHIKETIASHLAAKVSELRAEYERAYAICTQRPTELENLVNLAEEHRSIKGEFKRMSRETDELEALFAVVSNQGYCLPDQDALSLFRCRNLAVVLPRLEEEAKTYLNEKRWIQEDELRKARIELSSKMLDFKREKLQEIQSFGSVLLCDDYLLKIVQIEEEFKTLEDVGSEIVKKEQTLKLQNDPLDLSVSIRTDLSLHQRLWELCKQVPRLIKQLKKQLIVELNIDKLLHSCEALMAETEVILKVFDSSWKCHQAGSNVNQQLQHLLGFIPVLRIWSNPNTRDRHWPKLFEILQKQVQEQSPKDFKFGEIYDWRAFGYPISSHLMSLNESINNEHKLESTIESIRLQWDSYALPLRALRDSGTFYVESFREAMLIVEECVIQMEGVIHLKAGDKDAAKVAVMWHQVVKSTESILTAWSGAQKRFLSLRPFFVSKQMEGLTHQDSWIYTNVEDMWRASMMRVFEDPSLGAISKHKELLEIFQKIEHDFDFLQHTVDAFVAKARSEFPRFYFVAEHEILEILRVGHGFLPDLVTHVGKLFPGASSVNIRGTSNQIDGIKSSLGETLELVPAVFVSVNPQLSNLSRSGATRSLFEGQVQEPSIKAIRWLIILEDVMAKSVHRQIDKARKKFEVRSFEEWMKNHTQQSLVVAKSVLFASKIEEILCDVPNCRKQLSDSMAFKNSEVEIMAEVLNAQNSDLCRHKCTASIIQEIAERDVLQKLLVENPHGPKDFAWQSQFRYVWDFENTSLEGYIVVRVLEHQYPYGLEYLGNDVPLVWSLSLERCHKVVGSSLGSVTWGALAGNDSTNASFITSLANSFGTVCFSLRCDFQLSPIIMNRLCKGAVCSSFWLCFNSVDRVPGAVLQKLSTSLIGIQNAIRMKSAETSIEGEALRLRPTTGEIGDRPPPGFFVTVDKRSDGRVLPDSLAMLFRPIITQTPDIVHIIEVLLLAHGFKQSTTLAKQAVFAFEMLRERLAGSPHFDVSKSALMQVIHDVIKSKKQYLLEREDQLLIRTLLSKATSVAPDDVLNFYDTINALSDENVQVLAQSQSLSGRFSIFREDLTHFESHILLRKECPVDWKSKTMQLFSSACTRSGVIAIGKPCTGKTSCIQAMVDALKQTIAKNAKSGGIETTFLFPKALSPEALYGAAGRVTAEITEWACGLIPQMFLSLAEAQKDIHPKARLAFVILDGPMDPDWSDTFMQVLGDQGHFQLPNFESIDVPDHSTIIFEGDDISTASPGIVSRCAVVYFHKTAKAWQQSAALQMAGWDDNILNQRIWLDDDLYASGRDIFDCLLEHVMGPVLHFVETECDECFPSVCEIHRVWSHLNLFESSCLNELQRRADDIHAPKGNDLYRCEWFTNFFMLALVWSIGCSLEENSRGKFEVFLKDLLSNLKTNVKAETKGGKPSRAELKVTTFPESESAFGLYYLTSRAKNGWISWNQMLEPTAYKNLSAEGPEDLIIPTTNFIRNNFLLGQLLHARQPILVNGPAACGKTLYIQSKLRKELPDSRYSKLTYNMSPSTTTDDLQLLIWQRLETTSFRKLEPKGGKTLVVCIEDINLASRDAYGSSQVLDLIRHLLDKKSGYSKDSPPKLQGIGKFLTIATNQYKRGSTHNFPGRLLRHMFVMNIISTKDEQELSTIFSGNLRWYHEKQEFPGSITALREKVINATLAVYRETQEHLKPTILCPHYMFCLRDLNAVLSGMMLQTKEDLQQSTDSPENEHLRLWTHEVLRVFYDRIKDARDKEWFLNILKGVIKDHLQQDFNILFKHLDLNDDGDIDAEELRRLFFVGFQAGSSAQESGEVAGYDEVEDAESFMHLVTTLCQNYDKQNVHPMRLFISLYSVEHITRLTRVFQMRREHALLVGPTGVGKRSLTRIAAYVSKAKINELFAKVNPMEGREWRENLKRTIRQCGLGFIHNFVLVLSDQMMNSERMQDVCCILNGTEIPGLFTKEERENLVAEMSGRRLLPERDVQLSLDESYALLLKIAYNALHVVFCVDPCATSLRDLLTDYPSLATRSYIDWFDSWPAEALLQMAQSHLPNLFGPDLYNPTFVSKVVRACGKMHKAALDVAQSHAFKMKLSNVHITMADYSIFLKQFSAILSAKREENESETALLSAACKVSAHIHHLSKNADQSRAQILRNHEDHLALKLKEGSHLNMLRDVSSDLKKRIDILATNISENQKSLSAAEAAITREQGVIIEWWKSAAQVLVTLSPRDIGKLKSAVNMKNKCPDCVEDLAMSVCAILNGTLQPSETKDQRTALMVSCKNVIVSLDFKKRITGIDPKPEPTDLLVKGAAIVRDRFLKKTSFTYDQIARVCSGSEKIFSWLMEALAFEEKVRTIIEPLQATQKGLISERNEMQQERAKNLETHAEASEKLSAQQHLFEILCVRSSELEEELATCGRQADLSKVFSNLLADEFVDFPNDWANQLSQLTRARKDLDIDCLLSAAAITYLGGLPMNFRELAISSWINVLVTEELCNEGKSFDLSEFLLDFKELRLERRQFELDDLPTDELSVMNACLITRCYRSPLVIDPHGVFTSWIQIMEKKNGLIVVSSKEGYLGKVRYAVQEGLPILIKDIDTFLPIALQSLSSQQFMHSKGRKSVYIGDMLVPYNESFRMYMVTRDDCPGFLPEHSMWTTLVDFNLTRAGFQQCIFQGLVSEKLEPLHTFRGDHLERYIASARSLDESDPKHILPSSVEDLIMDEDMLENMERVREDWMNARSMAMDSLRRYKAASERASMVDAVASPLSSLFEALWIMTPLHVSYQNVQNSFVTLVLMDLDSAEGNHEIENVILRENKSVFEDLCVGLEDFGDMELDKNQIEADLEELGSALTQMVFFDLVRSIYEKDHLLFAFLVAVKTQICKGLISPEDFQHFLTDGRSRVPVGAEIPGTERVEIDDDDTDQKVFEGFGRTGLRSHLKSDNPGFPWLSEHMWESACRLSSLRSIRNAFGRDGVAGSIVAHSQAWQDFLETPQPMHASLPDALSVRLSHFQKLLLLRIFHPHCVLAGMVQVVQDWCGVDVSRIPPLEISAAYDDSLSTIPLLFLVDPGADPTQDIRNFARSHFKSNQSQRLVVSETSMFFAESFEATLIDCMEKGNWLLIRNAHTEASLLTRLEEGMMKIGTGDPHDNFRLWITSRPVNLSKVVYRSSMRVVWDSPVSVRASLLRSYSSAPLIQDDFFFIGRSDMENRLFKKCLLALCMMHAAVLERCSHGATGWNFPPELAETDLKFCMIRMKDVLHSFPEMTVKDVRELVGNLIYAGKIADMHDLRTFQAMLISFFPDSLLGQNLEYTEDGTYYMPQLDSLAEFRAFIAGFPTIADASLFGLHTSCNIKRLRGEADFYMRRLQDVYFLRPLEIQEDEARGHERLYKVLMLDDTRNKVETILGSIPQQFDIEFAKSKYPIGKQDHRNRVLLQELEARNTLLSAICVSLNDLLRTLRGSDAVTIEMEQMMLSLYYQRPPDIWLRNSTYSRKSLGAYLDLVHKSNAFFNTWLFAGFPTSSWLPAFFFPNLLLNTTSINFAQSCKIGIEMVSLCYDILETDPQSTSMMTGIFLTGLSLTGACWNFSQGKLHPLVTQSRPEADSRRVSAKSKFKEEGDGGSLIFAASSCWSVPVLHVKPLKTPARIEGQLDTAGSKLYFCPMYRTNCRKNVNVKVVHPYASSGFIVDVVLPCSAPLNVCDPQHLYARLNASFLVEVD